MATINTPTSHIFSLHSPRPAAPKHYLLYFITGNPGLIGYYTTFLTTLSSLLHTSSSSKISYSIAGRSLLGFAPNDNQRGHGVGPFSLENVIQDVRTNIVRAFNSGAAEGKKYDGVILIGHSVGSYISLEVLHRLRAANSTDDVRPMAAVLLFPTVTHIAKSPSGVNLTKMLSVIPNLPGLVHTASQYAFWPFPDGVFKGMIKGVTGMSDDAVATTASFLRSENGVRQALFMARDEMETITDDAWGEEIWGAEKDLEKDGGEKGKSPRLVFCFGEDDHWVADHTRDELVKRRGNRGERVRMVLDENKIPHGFCIHHSEEVAEKVAVWLREIVEAESF